MLRLRPLAKERRHPADYRDELEHAEVAKILSELPDDHIAIYAYYTGARGAADSIGLGHLLADRMDLVERLAAAYNKASGRGWARSPGHSFPDWAKAGKLTARPPSSRQLGRKEALHLKF
jgi:hypothetical protein